MDRSAYYHNELIIDQFTRQAVLFAKKSAQNIDETFERILSLVEVTENDIILLDVACGSGSIAVGFAKLSKQVTHEMNRVCDIGGQIVVIDPTPSANSFNI